MSTHSLDFGEPSPHADHPVGTIRPGLPPLSEDPDYPPVLRELAELVQDELIKVDVPAARAAAIAETMAEHVRERYGGQPVYWPKGHTMRARQRRAAMWRDFTGDNYRELSERYGMCLQQAYKAITMAKKEFLDKTQGDLFKGQG
jgi:Mor family transcriptional regulator